MQPAFAILLRQGFESFWQIMRFGAWNDGVPDGISAGWKALERIDHHVQHAPIVALDFIAGIAEQQSPAGRWRQKFLGALKTILQQRSHLAAGIQLCHIAFQGAHVGRVQFEQFEPVVCPQQMVNDER